MFGKKYPVLTETTCELLENIRLAIEVYTGKRTRFVNADLNTGKGRVRVDGTYTDIEFDSYGVRFCFGSELLIAYFDGDRARVSSDNPRVIDTIAGPFPLRWTGTSLNDRTEEPLFLSEFLYCAKARGLTPEQLMNSKS